MLNEPIFLYVFAKHSMTAVRYRDDIFLSYDCHFMDAVDSDFNTALPKRNYLVDEYLKT